MQFFKKIDILSPPITLYFKGDREHSSIFSGILSIIVSLLILAATIYYFLGFINKDSPKAYFFSRYIEDAGNFPLNSSSMFNYVQFVDKKDGAKNSFDLTAFRAIGVDDIYYEEYMNNPEKALTVDHWIYGPCNYETDIQGIENIIDKVIYNNSACIRKYYDKSKEQYFNSGENGFKWPMLQRGMSNKNSTYYGIIVQRCDKAPEFLKAQGPECKSSAEIDEVISKISLRYQIIDHYADMLNYEVPFTKYFYEITSAVTNGIYIINHLNFNPADMITHNGFFFDNIVEEHSYFFTQNEKHTIEEVNLPEGQSTNGCLIGIYFWMQNTLQHYERTYDRVQDFLSDIGGISSIIMTIAYYINLIANYYINIVDTEELILNRDTVNFGGTKKSKRPTILRKVKDNEMENPPKKKMKIKRKTLAKTNIYNQENYKGDGVENINIYQIPNTNVINESKRSDSNINIYNHNRNSNIRNLEASNKRKINEISDANYINKESNKSNNNTFVEDDNDKNENDKEIKKEETIKKKKSFNFFNYIYYLICCGSNNKKIRYYENIRETLISEENIIQNYLDIYNLLKINNIPKKDILITKE